MLIHWDSTSLPGGEWRGERISYIGEWCRLVPNSIAEYNHARPNSLSHNQLDYFFKPLTYSAL